MTLARGTFEVRNKLGLHARAATKLVQLASKYPCEIVLSRAGQAANAKSVMGVLLLCGSKGTLLDIEATGDQANEAVSEIGRLIADRFGEGE
jgi:phosphocarrier protein HPr